MAQAKVPSHCRAAVVPTAPGCGDTLTSSPHTHGGATAQDKRCLVRPWFFLSPVLDAADFANTLVSFDCTPYAATAQDILSLVFGWRYRSKRSEAVGRSVAIQILSYVNFAPSSLRCPRRFPPYPGGFRVVKQSAVHVFSGYYD